MHSHELAWYVERVLSFVRFRHDHAAIREELEDHICECFSFYEAQGLPKEEARARCLQDMGDAETVGKALDRAHSPLVGRLYLATQVLAGLLIVLAVLHWGGLLIGLAARVVNADEYMTEPEGAVVYDIALWETAKIDNRYLFLTRARYDDSGALVLQYWEFELWGTWSFNGIGTLTDDRGRSG